ncbi:glycosyl hydrolase family 18 protein [Paludifilum halophilum]|uniref:Spore gernimation protein n=1 Tax=Paludifilum halophilum TaxID=1642702 RepID=A0A235B945_9BACL|nr:glycosyl hydrolase family 18 protein [Paludifilum halophilum]OYD08828.1 spore gernimation protein [Paludifilum halophilum]
MRKTTFVHVLLCTVLVFTGCGTGGNGNQGSNHSSPEPQANRQHPGPTQPEKITHPEKGSGRNRNSPVIETNGYLQPNTSETDRRIVDRMAKYLTYISPFSYRVKPNGDLIPLEDEAAMEEIHRRRTSPMLVITNFEEGTFSPEIPRSIFNDSKARKRLIKNVLNTLEKKDFYALNIDFEHIRPEDKKKYNDFLREITPRVKKAGYPVSTALAPKTSAKQTGGWHGAHDYAAHGKIVDFVVLMTYEWGWTGGPPMAVAPTPKVRQVLDYATSVIPRDKIMMGAPLYGYDWRLPYREGTNAKKISPVEAAALAKKRGATINYDQKDQAPWFKYTDDNGNDHIVWYENKQSVQAKLDLVKKYNLRGISYWVLGDEFPENWQLLNKQFRIRKHG